MCQLTTTRHDGAHLDEGEDLVGLSRSWGQNVLQPGKRDAVQRLDHAGGEPSLIGPQFGIGRDWPSPEKRCEALTDLRGVRVHDLMRQYRR